jgi:CPA2 family monovalent cation:H+ antiporter-2
MDYLDPIVSIAILLAAALVGGMIAHRLRQPVILGYIVIGIFVGPHALGLVDDPTLVEAAATIGVALLMFTLGLEVSIDQLRQVGKVGLWGGMAQITVTFALGTLAGFFLFDWLLPQAILLGLAISLSSTAVCFKVLMERGELSSVHGRIMIAILILQDISVVLMMIILPLIGGQSQNVLLTLAIALGEAILFIGIAVFSGFWLLPWLMGRIGGVRSRELFLLTVLVLCLGTALGTQIFGLSMVFGAFLIGMVIRESRFAHQALAEITPLRDIFATLFFVSLGMLLPPDFVLSNWQPILLMVSVIIGVKLLVTFGVVRLFGYSNRIAFLASAGLFQIGEFSFILAQGGISMGIISEHSYSLILTSAIITMLLTPLSISLAFRFYARLAHISRRKIGASPIPPASPSIEIPARVVVAGYGRVGQNIARGLHDADIPYIVLDIDPERISEARHGGIPRIYGDASNPHVLSKAGLNNARILAITFPDPIAVFSAVKAAQTINPNLQIIARVHRVKDANILAEMGVKELVNPEYEASLEFMERILVDSGWRKTAIRQTLPVLERDEEFFEFDPD